MHVIDKNEAKEKYDLLQIKLNLPIKNYKNRAPLFYCTCVRSEVALLFSQQK